MLGKTAAHIFWMFRYLERCENTARLINASHFISLTQKQNIANHWDSILNVAGNKKPFLSKYGAMNKTAVVTPKAIIDTIISILISLFDL